MKYPRIELGQIEAVINKLGGVEGMSRFLSNDDFIVMERTRFRVEVDYSKSLPDMLRATRVKLEEINGSFVNLDMRLTDGSLVSFQEPVVQTLNMEIVQYESGITADEILQDLQSRRMRAATYWELLAFQAAHRNFMRRFHLLALGSLASTTYTGGQPKIGEPMYYEAPGVSERGANLFLQEIGSSEEPAEWLAEQFRFLAIHT